MPHSPANRSSKRTDSPVDHQQLAYLNGRWVKQDQLAVSISDDGFRFAATAVERLRTYHGRVFRLASHLSRWRGTIAALGITGGPSEAVIGELIDELLRQNEPVVSRCGDVGITIVATPGSSDRRTPTFALHLNVIDHDQTQARRRVGQPLVITDVVQPPPSSWPREIKVRCRLHYYLADRIGRQANTDASAVLLDEDGTITETSISNIAIVKNGSVASPPHDRILGGITQQVIQEIAKAQSISWTKRPIAIQDLLGADEVLLMGTDTGIWFCNRVDNDSIAAGPVYAKLVEAFDGLVSEECCDVDVDLAE